eukprot:UN25691
MRPPSLEQAARGAALVQEVRSSMNGLSVEAAEKAARKIIRRQLKSLDENEVSEELLARLQRPAFPFDAARIDSIENVRLAMAFHVGIARNPESPVALSSLACLAAPTIDQTVPVGARVMCDFDAQGTYFPGTVIAFHAHFGTYDVRYDDDDTEECIMACNLRLFTDDDEDDDDDDDSGDEQTDTKITRCIASPLRRNVRKVNQSVVTRKTSPTVMKYHVKEKERER